MAGGNYLKYYRQREVIIQGRRLIEGRLLVEEIRHVGFLFCHSILVRLVQPCSIYVGILFGLSVLVRIVRPCSMYVGMFFLVRLVRPSSAVYVGILFRPSHVSTLSTAMFYVCWYFIRS